MTSEESEVKTTDGAPDAATKTPSAEAEEVKQTTTADAEPQAEDVDVDADADGGQEETAAGDEEVPTLYQTALPNRVIVSMHRALQFYVDRSRRVLRVNEDLRIIARGSNISVACTLVEVLKRQKIGKVTSIRTEMSTEPIFDRFGNAIWRRPISQITFVIERGEFATYVSDYHQRKVIEIFEKEDPECTGTLSLEQIENLQLEDAFKADEQQRVAAADFRSRCDSPQMNLPDFIRYCSILIHPLLRDRIFKEILSDKFGLTTERVDQRRR